MADRAALAPRLLFRFIGEWHPVLLGDSSDALVKEFAAHVVGRLDDRATARALLREDLAAVVEQARSGEAEAVFVVTAVGGQPVSAILTVYPVTGARLSPAIGTDPRDVIEVLRTSFRALDREGIDDAIELEVPGSRVLRLQRMREEQREEHGEVFTIRSLTADYWYTVPGTKNVLLVNFITPMGDIPNVMLSFFDAIVRASYFELPEAPDDPVAGDA